MEDLSAPQRPDEPAPPEPGPPDVAPPEAPAGDLSAFSLTDMLRCSDELRRVTAHAPDFTDACRQVIDYLRTAFRDPSTGTASCVLARLFVTRRYAQCSRGVQAFLDERLPAADRHPDLRCLVLEASSGDEPAWCDPASSRDHRAIPLVSADAVGKAPMVAALLRDLGLNVAAVVTGTAEHPARFDVLHVPEAKGSPLVPAQDFVTRHGVHSVLGFGGALPDREFFAVVLFSRTAIPAHTAHLFATLAVEVRLGLLAHVPGGMALLADGALHVRDAAATGQGSSLREVLTASSVGRDLLAVDWAATPLGEIGSWPQSLQTAVRILVSSRFSMWMAWGPELTFFCNDAYRRDTLGGKYPWALGRPTRQVWAEIWAEISPRIEEVMATGQATWDDALLLFLQRHGYVEETYHTFSYSPLSDDDGRIAGMLCVVSEDTERVIAERHMATLRDLGAAAAGAHTETQLLAAVCQRLAEDPRSLPFTLLYLFEPDATTARLAGAIGMPDGHRAAPPTLAVGDPAAPWPAATLADGTPVLLDHLDKRFTQLPAGAWPEPPAQALLVPLTAPAQQRPYGFLVAGLNHYRPLDADYRGFLDLLAGQIAAGIGTARAYEAARARAAALAELDAAKTAFFTNVSHEFRTPLTLLLGPAEDALADTTQPLPAPQRARIEVVHRNAQRLLALVNTLLDFSRLTSGHTSACFEPVALDRYTAELAAMFETATDRAGLALSIDCPPLPAPVYIDRDMWAKIVLNLLSNAVKFTFTGGITVTLHAAGGHAVLAVTDTGTGIAEADQARLFERFHRIRGARGRTHEGSGIGLALVAELTAVHGGAVAVDSTPGVGSRFTVTIPFGAAHLPPDQVIADQPATENPTGAQAAGEQAVGEKAAGQGRPTGQVGEPVPAQRRAAPYVTETLRWLGTDPAHAGAAAPQDPPDPPDGAGRVLVVDDNPDMRGYIVDLLAGHYTVSGAPDGAAALELARVDPPDLVLTDVMMPNLDGFGLLAALRADAATMGIPVIMLSARAGEDGTIEGLEAGADDYLTKPFSARELLARVRANLELDRSRRIRTELAQQRELLDEAQRVARVGSWQLDLATGSVTGSREYFRLLEVDPAEFATGGLPVALRYVHPDDLHRTAAALEAGAAGAEIDLQLRVLPAGGGVRLVRARGGLHPGADGHPGVLRGSLQDITAEHEAEQAQLAAAAAQQAAAREHHIAEALQTSLLPAPGFDPDYLQVATYYRAGVEGTQVGGDWFDVIELGAGRTALVIGDVMGRGVCAAAVMGQLRATVRAYARLDLPPADVLALLDPAVGELAGDQIVTCVYAVYDPAEASLTHARAGHLPPLLLHPDGTVQQLTGAAGPPLGTGAAKLTEEQVHLPPGAMLALYTDGLVERRDRDLDTGMAALAAALAAGTGPLEERLEPLVEALTGGAPDDDIAVLLAQVPTSAQHTAAASRCIDADPAAVPTTRAFIAGQLRDWQIPAELAADVEVAAGELVTNAILHGVPPLQLRLRRTPVHLVVEVHDHTPCLPRRQWPDRHDEGGRGLQLLATLADRWGTRPTEHGKAVWATFTLHRHGSPAESRGAPAGRSNDGEQALP